jgi:hypothetical protein
VGKEGTGFVTFSRPDRVFTDACQSINGFHPGPMTTLDGLVAALSEQGGWAEVTAPSDITVDGYAGRAFQRTAPTEFTGCSTGFAPFRSWENDDPNGLGWSYYEPGEIETLWVLDLDGTVIIVNTRMLPDHRATAVAELDAVLDSIRIDGGLDTSRVPGSDPIDSGVTSPLEAVTENLVNGADVALFRVNADEPSYWRVTTLAPSSTVARSNPRRAI